MFLTLIFRVQHEKPNQVNSPYCCSYFCQFFPKFSVFLKSWNMSALPHNIRITGRLLCFLINWIFSFFIKIRKCNQRLQKLPLRENDSEWLSSKHIVIIYLVNYIGSSYVFLVLYLLPEIYLIQHFSRKVFFVCNK